MKPVTRSAAGEEFAALVKAEIEDEQIDLVAAALAIARTEYPNLDSAQYVSRLCQLGDRVRARITDVGDPTQSIAALNHVLYAEEGFAGNSEDYYDARNSFLNDVLDRKRGIPITLAMLYMEVPLRAGMHVEGINFTGNFLIRCPARRVLMY